MLYSLKWMEVVMSPKMKSGFTLYSYLSPESGERVYVVCDRKGEVFTTTKPKRLRRYMKG